MQPKNVEAQKRNSRPAHQLYHEEKTSNKRIFSSGAVTSNTYTRLKACIAEKLDDPELKKIRLYDLRHYYATMLYYRTEDILLVKEKLGHKNINNTLIHTHLVNFNDKEEYYSATAKTVDEAAKLLEQGFEFVTDIDGVKLFRKRKWQSFPPFFFCSADHLRAL